MTVFQGNASPKTHPPQANAVLPLFKPSGPTSTACLSALKRQGQKKIGHAGTLDPLASGMLLVLLGQATKLSHWLLSAGRKVYAGRIQLGIVTDTWDITGNIIERHSNYSICKEDVMREISSWKGSLEQLVPFFSAAKYNGKPLYKFARKGQSVPEKIKQVEIFEADMLSFGMPYVDFRVSCSSGTYIRSLAHSLGTRLGCGAVLCELTREYSYPFGLADACPMEAVDDGTWLDYARPITDALPDWPNIDLDQTWAERIRNGVAAPVCTHHPDAENAILCHKGEALAIGRRDGSSWIVERGLWIS